MEGFDDMLERHVRTLRDLLGVAMEAAGVAKASDVDYDANGRFFLVEGTGVEIVLEKTGWRVREAYDVADLKEGGTRVAEETVGVARIGEEGLAAKLAAMRVVERKIDGAIDEMG